METKLKEAGHKMEDGLKQAGQHLKNLFHHDPDLNSEMFGKVLKNQLVKGNAKLKMKTVELEKHHVALDEDAKQFFEEANVGEGNEFMAILPWKGAIKEPTSHPPINKDKPDVSYEMDFVFGYKSDEARQNCFYNPRKKPVYMTAAIGVVLDPKTRTQKFFGGGETQNMERKQTDFSVNFHTDDITCLALTQDRQTVATGQVGVSPLVFIWDSISALIKGQYRLPKGSRQVNAIAFNKNGSLLATADFHNDHNIFVHNWQTGQQLWTRKSGPDKVFMIDWNLIEDNFCSVGPNSVYFWDMGGNKKKGSFGGANKQTNILCVSHDTEGTAFCGAQNGSIYKFAVGGAAKSAHETHKGIIHCIKYLEDQDNKVLISGGTDLKVVVSVPDTMEKIKIVSVDGIPRSVDFSKYLLVGMRNGLIAEYDLEKNAKEIIMHSHHDGEVWGLCVLEEDGKYITSGDDNKLLMYDIATRKCIQKGQIIVDNGDDSPPSKQEAKAGYVGGASTTSKEPADRQSRAVSWNSEMKHLAVADNLGRVTIRQIELTQVKGQPLNNMNNIIKTLTNSKEWIECMSYNPNHSRLAVGSHDNNIYVYNTSNYALFATLKAHTSFVTALDWSINTNPQYIRSNCGGYELLFFNVDQKKQDKGGASNTVGTIWSSQSCKLGWSVEGIFPEGCDGTHINGVDQCDDLTIISTGDDYGLVNIYRNPVRNNQHQTRSYRGHSEHVTRVKFIKEGQYLLSIGGMDQTVIQWKQTIPQ